MQCPAIFITNDGDTFRCTVHGPDLTLDGRHKGPHHSSCTGRRTEGGYVFWHYSIADVTWRNPATGEG